MVLCKIVFYFHSLQTLDTIKRPETSLNDPTRLFKHFIQTLPDISNDKIPELQQCLFSSPTSFALAHCVSKDFVMGQGIALKFKQRFHGVEHLKKQNKTVGQVASLSYQGRHIYYLITKQKYYEKPTYISLFKCLLELRDILKMLQIKKLALPKIACGLDRLKWSIVSKMIYYLFKNTSVFIVIYKGNK
jgi:hypothetical protein